MSNALLDPVTTYDPRADVSPPTDADGYKHDRHAVATLLRAYRPMMSDEQWRTVLRFWAARREDAVLPPHLVSPI